MKYELDMSGVENTSLSPEALLFKIPCKTGLHQLEFDVIECDVPKNIYNELVKSAPGHGNAEQFQVGFNTIPVGATLKSIS